MSDSLQDLTQVQYKLICGDCLVEMNNIPTESIDMVLCDLPYGTTKNSWDKPLPLNQLWEHYNRICKPNACIALFSQPPYIADLIKSNPKNFRYEWIWVKSMATGFLNANKMPLKAHENILIFYKKLPTYNPQMVKGKPHKRSKLDKGSSNYSNYSNRTTSMSDEYYPTDILEFGTEIRYHPTQKPVPLLSYLIETYTKVGDTILDNCMGSGSTGVAAYNLKRNFIGIECESSYLKIAENRLKSLGF